MDEKEVDEGPALIEQGWAKCLELVALGIAELESSARRDKALLRRRQIRSGNDLLRVAFVYALGGANLQTVALWTAQHGLGRLSAVALSYRLRGCRAWLGALVAACLLERNVQLSGQAVRLRIIDASFASKPRSSGNDWRIHLSLDLGRMCLDEVELTDAHGGETLTRHRCRPGDIILADAGHAHARGLGDGISSGARLLVRTNWQNLPLRLRTGERLDIATWLHELGSVDSAECLVLLDTPKGTYEVRLIAGRLPHKAANAARKRKCKEARKKKHRIDERTLFAAGFVLLISNLPQDRWSTSDVLALYRVRWQVELHIKRDKSIIHLDDLRGQHQDLAQTYLLCKILAVLIVDALIMQTKECYPEWFQSLERPISIWRLTGLCKDYLIGIVRGQVGPPFAQLILPGYRQYLCDSPRKRTRQLPYALRLLANASATNTRMPQL